MGDAIASANPTNRVYTNPFQTLMQAMPGNDSGDVNEVWRHWWETIDQDGSLFLVGLPVLSRLSYKLAGAHLDKAASTEPKTLSAAWLKRSVLAIMQMNDLSPPCGVVLGPWADLKHLRGTTTSTTGHFSSIH